MPLIETLDFHGQPAQALILPQGDRVMVAEHGAQLLSWQSADGVERLYLSPQARLDGRSPIRGGVPVCWPQFNQRGPLVKHGFARGLPWAPVQAANPPGTPANAHALHWRLRDDSATRAQWPHPFELTLSACLSPGALRISLAVLNPGDQPMSFTAALHSYLRVPDATLAELHGLQGAARWDAVRDVRNLETAPALRFGQEFDSVYSAPDMPLRLRTGSTADLQITHSTTCRETVVWNPGPALSAALDDMPDDGWRHMLCVEAACIDTPVLLAPGAQWHAWQELRVLA